MLHTGLRAALAEIEKASKNRVVVEGKRVLKMNFEEAFDHHVHATVLRAAGLISAALLNKPEFK